MVPTTPREARPSGEARPSDPRPQDGTVWDDAHLANPHRDEQKRDKVKRMFAAIAPSYDLNNRVHSGWIDQYWRRKTVRIADVRPTDHVVDVACGTGDLTLAFAAAGPARVTGVDFTYEMLPLARGKRVGGGCPVTFVTGDAQALPLPDGCCDVVSIAFGIRNVQDVGAALREFRRVLRPGGRVVVLEFAVPRNRLFRGLYQFYSARVMPLTATWISGDRSGAYRYLPQSVETFLTPHEMKEKLAEAGFVGVTATPLTFGAVVVYRGEVRTG